MTLTDEQANEFYLAIGGLQVNLNSLEFCLRGVLYENSSQPHNALALGVNINTFSVGDIVPENAITDYSTLGELIRRYNMEIAGNDPNQMIDESIVELRDALAHGRVSSAVLDDHIKIIKFSRPKNSMVQVTYAQEMTIGWLKENTKKVYAAAVKVISKMKKE